MQDVEVKRKNWLEEDEFTSPAWFQKLFLIRNDSELAVS